MLAGCNMSFKYTSVDQYGSDTVYIFCDYNVHVINMLNNEFDAFV